jgi:hypothetical protein
MKLINVKEQSIARAKRKEMKKAMSTTSASRKNVFIS